MWKRAEASIWLGCYSSFWSAEAAIATSIFQFRTYEIFMSSTTIRSLDLIDVKTTKNTYLSISRIVMTVASSAGPLPPGLLMGGISVVVAGTPSLTIAMHNTTDSTMTRVRPYLIFRKKLRVIGHMQRLQFDRFCCWRTLSHSKNILPPKEFLVYASMPLSTVSRQLPCFLSFVNRVKRMTVSNLQAHIACSKHFPEFLKTSTTHTRLIID